MPEGTSTIQEVNFWSELEDLLIRINEQIDSPEVVCTLQLLRRNAKARLAILPIEKDNMGLKKLTERGILII